MVRAGDTVIDVRRPEEFARGHIAGAINIPIETLPGGIDGIDGQVLTACSMGGRAARAANTLVAAGHAAFVIEGGTKAWAAAGFPVVPPAAAAWLR
jgi:rhodanese-related sulfurtransferase